MKTCWFYIRLIISALIGVKSDKTHEHEPYDHGLLPYILAGISLALLSVGIFITLAYLSLH